jgi:hypothetical protein
MASQITPKPPGAGTVLNEVVAGKGKFCDPAVVGVCESPVTQKAFNSAQLDEVD